MALLSASMHQLIPYRVEAFCNAAAFKSWHINLAVSLQRHRASLPRPSCARQGRKSIGKVEERLGSTIRNFSDTSTCSLPEQCLMPDAHSRRAEHATLCALCRCA